MKKLLFLLSLIISFSSLCQTNSIKQLNGFKYAILESDDYQIKDALETVGIVAYFKNDSLPDFVKKNPCQITNVSSRMYSKNGLTVFRPFFIDLSFNDCLGNTFLVITKNDYAYNRALIKSLKKLNSLIYSYDPSMTPKRKPNTLWLIDSEQNGPDIDYHSETSVRNYFDKNGTNGIEGIWEFSSGGINNYKLAIVKNDYIYDCIIIEGEGGWKPGALKGIFKPAVSDDAVIIQWTLGDQITRIKTVGTVEDNAIIKFNFNRAYLGGTMETSAVLYKVYPKFKQKKKNTEIKKEERAEKGSVVLTKEDAKKQLIELKEYLDLGIITQEEFDKKAISLKKILLGD